MRECSVGPDGNPRGVQTEDGRGGRSRGAGTGHGRLWRKVEGREAFVASRDLFILHFSLSESQCA